ncbi:helix-turn-helix transcriptional regulator [Rhodococcoides corynebacterioides]|uniref:helix-turn-helix transcriptional regulator n=1 Tax=Rhodococcoides corynebacterioides TaxID=53972 RepID=UPI001C9AFEB1|nr:LuxR C-terminal-related transcriptional regulator [Rhodococcus corynebacterioides]MBY6349611.1 GAF domain-containing protein [Rhodococcus corynebacterioides]
MIASTSSRMDTAVARLRQATGVSLAFGGTVGASRKLSLAHFCGRSVGALDGVALEPGQGLGGRVLQIGRTVSVDDYTTTSVISHRYDAIIAAEGLRAMIAAPVVVNERHVGVLYGANHRVGIIGGRVLDALSDEARRVGQELAVDEERARSDRLREDIRLAYANLRLLAARVDDPTVKAALDRAGADLAGAVVGGVEPDTSCVLTARELDVVALVATGKSNAAVAESLGLTVGTVKSYMKSIMVKLGATTRMEAATSARRAGLLP